ncbi:HEAT repeat-containing protein 3 [Hyalella azteca]|uniref:HEAT repeat-containing protein 3 n=1 Tax=Hyalella azteca TaxID=294128 RepID=A0A8B7P3N2_HYAAZ|nr:HEAT repeat-containing protein 3 [Hyalella azteca]
MGKFREKSKLTSNRFNPHSGRPSKPTKKEPQGLAVIYEKLNCIEECDYLHGLQSLAALAGDGLDAVTTILEFAGNDVGGSGALLRILSWYLPHQKLYVRLAAVGALRNLSSCGSSSHIELLLQSDVLSKLCQMVPNYLETLMSPTINEASEVAEIFSILEQIAFIFYNLCEASAEATTVVSESPGVLQSLVQLSSASLTKSLPHKTPDSCCLAVNLALLCLSEDNPPVCDELESYTEHLMEVIRQEDASSFSKEIDATNAFRLFNALTVSGILVNLDTCGALDEFATLLTNLVERALSVSPHQLLVQHVAAVPLPLQENNTTEPHSPILSPDDLNQWSIMGDSNTSQLNEKHETSDTNGTTNVDGSEMIDGDENEATDKEIVLHFEQKNAEQDNGCLSSKGWKAVEYWLEAQQLALELLNNLCCGSDKDSSVVDKRRPTLEEDVEEDMDQEKDWEPCEETDLEEKIVKPLLEKHQLFKRILALLQPLPPELQSVEDSKYAKQLLTLVTGVRVRSLSTLQAVLELLDMDQLGGPASLFETWTELGRLAFAEQQQQKIEAGILEGATGAMRAVVTKFSPEHASHLSAITASELQVLFSVGLSSSEAGVRRNLARLVGVLGCLLLTQGSAQDLMRDPAKSVLLTATEFLLQVCDNAEALDVIIDLYSDDRTDFLAAQCDLVTRLRNIVHYFNARYKQNKKNLAEHRVLLITVKDNLPAFIKYKEPRVLNADPSKPHASKPRPGGPKNKQKSKRK